MNNSSLNNPSNFLPDYTAGIDMKAQLCSTEGYRAEMDGLVIFDSRPGNQKTTLYVDDEIIATRDGAGNVYAETYSIPLRAGNTIRFSVSVIYVSSAFFFPYRR